MQRIRHAKEKDKKAILDIAKSTGVFSPDELSCLSDDFDNVLSPDDTDEFLVFEDDKTILGFIQFGPLPITVNSWCLYWIAVGKKSQGKGLASKLVERMEKEVKDKRGRIIFIETSSTAPYEKTRTFYMKCHYYPVAVIPEYYNIYDSKVIYSKNLLAESVQSGLKPKA